MRANSLLPTSYILHPTSYVLRPTSYFLLPTLLQARSFSGGGEAGVHHSWCTQLQAPPTVSVERLEQCTLEPITKTPASTFQYSHSSGRASP